MKLVRVRRKDGSSYLAEVLENPRTTHDHPHKHWMIVKGKGMIQFEHKHRHVHVNGSLKFHAHRHTSEQLRGMFRSANVSKNARPHGGRLLSDLELGSIPCGLGGQLCQ